MNAIEAKLLKEQLPKLKGKRYILNGSTAPFSLTEIIVKEVNASFEVFVILKEEIPDGDKWEVNIVSLSEIFTELK